MKRKHFVLIVCLLVVLAALAGFVGLKAWADTNCVVIIQAATAAGGPAYASLGTTEGYDFTKDPWCVGGWSMDSAAGVDVVDRCNIGSDLRETGTTIDLTTTVPSGWSGFGKDFEADDTECLTHEDGRATDLSGADQEFSFCAIFKMEGATEDAQFFGKYNTTGDQRSIKLRYDYSDAAFVAVISPSTGTTAYILTAATDVNDGDWHSVCMVYNDIDLRVYVDGEVDNNGANNPLAHTTGLNDSTEEFVFGCINTLGGSPFDGIFLEAMYLDRSMNPYEVAQFHDWGLSGDKGGANREVICFDGFEFMADAEEWDDDGFWSETNATTSVYVADDDADPAIGAMAGMQVAQATSAEREIRYDFTGPGSGYITAKYYAAISGTPTTAQTMLNLGDQTTPILNVRVDAGQDYQAFDNTAWVDLFTNFNASRWNVIEIETNLDDSDGTDSYKIWMNGIEATNSPFDTVSRADPDVIESLRTNQYWLGSGQYAWFDNAEVYKGQRVNYEGCPAGTYDAWWDGNFPVANHACGTDGGLSEPGISTGDGVFNSDYGKDGSVGWRYTNDDYIDWQDGADFEPFNKTTGTLWVELKGATGCNTTGDQNVIQLYSDSPSTNYIKMHMEVDTPGEIRGYYYQGGTAYRVDSTETIICDGSTFNTIGFSWNATTGTDLAVTVGNTWDSGTVSADRDFPVWTTPTPDSVSLGTAIGQTYTLDVNQWAITDGWQDVCPWCTHLNEEMFEATDGINLADLGDWSGTSNDVIEISDAQAYDGLTSLAIDSTNTTATYSVEHAFTEITKGIFTIHLRFRTPSITDSGTSLYPVILLEDDVGTNILQAGFYQDDFVHYNASKVTLSAASISVDTWHKLEIEVDADNDTMDIYLDDSLISNDLAFYATADPSVITHRDWAGSGTMTYFIDSQFIYFGTHRTICNDSDAK